jgi:hypothetical protein
MKILYITSSGEDYLQDQVLIGLRSIYGENVIDYPKKDVLYENFAKPKKELYGCGFTIWKNLPDIAIDRNDIYSRVENGEFDAIIFGSIWRQEEIFTQFRFHNIFNKNRAKICFIDGEDHDKLYLPSLFCGTYFKREQGKLFGLPFVKKINFSIPNIKIRHQSIAKEKVFAIHVQCEEAYKIEEIRKNCQRNYAFSDEDLYYDDIARSQYAITMKKSGWDCMRHYEIAANWTVPCFYKLSKKPKSCAPHGLVDMKNVVAFDTADEMKEKINYINKFDLYSQLQLGAIAWARNNSCQQIAKMVMEQI